MSPAAVAWVEALLASLWQAPLLAALAWLFEQAFAERASARHAIRVVALLGAPLALVATGLGWLPGLDLDAWAGVAEPSRSTLASPIPTAPPRWIPWTLAAWVFGALLMTARTAMQWRAVEALRRTAQPLPPAWLATVDSIARALAIRPPRVALSCT